MGVPIANNIVRVSIRICALRVMVSNLAIMTNLLLLWNSALTFIWSKSIFLQNFNHSLLHEFMDFNNCMN